MNYIYNDEDNQPMHEEHFPPEDRSCKACHAKFWCEKEKKKLAAKCLFHEALLDELREWLGEENVVMK
jgi:hypothetical protein